MAKANHIRKITRGSNDLRAKLGKPGAIAELARKLELSAELVSRWTTGWRTPSTKVKAYLSDELGIPWRWWDEPAAEGEVSQGAPAEPTDTFRGNRVASS